MRLARINYGAQKQAKAESDADIMPDKKSRKQESFSGHESTQRPRGSCRLPSSIQTILSALELHQVMREALVGFTTDREFHPAPKVIKL